jgi:hypothetical protein
MNKRSRGSGSPLAIMESRSITSDKVYSRKQIGEAAAVLIVCRV